MSGSQIRDILKRYQNSWRSEARGNLLDWDEELDKATKEIENVLETKTSHLQNLFLEYERELTELNRKFNNEWIHASTKTLVEAHGELDRKFINEVHREVQSL